MLKLYILELWRFRVITLDHNVSGRLHFTEMISPSFSILSSVESASIPIRVLSGVINNVPFVFFKNSECYALAYQSTHMRRA